MLLLGCGKVNLAPAPGPGYFSGRSHRVNLDETDVPAAQQAADEQTWVSRADAHPMGACGTEPPPEKGAQTADRRASHQTRGALKPEALPRSWRLTRTSDLTAVLRTGYRRHTPRLDISWRGNELGHPRLGVVVPRHGRTAVRRNRLRRRLREMARRRILPRLTSVDVVIRSKSPAYDAPLADLEGDLTGWLHSLDS